MVDLPKEDRLLPDKRLYETLMNSIRGIVWEADPLTYKFTYVSPHAERILGYTARQWIDEPDFWRTHAHPDDVGWASAYCRAASAKGEDHEFQYRMLAADGRIVWLHDIVTVVRSDDGVVRLRGIMFDITERKKAEDAQRASEEQLRVIFDTSHSGIIMIDPDGHISFANKRMTKMFGCPLSELIGSPYLKHLHPEERQYNNNLLERLMRRESDNGAAERHFLHCDGSDFWGYVTTTRLKTKTGEPQALIAVVTDITDRKAQQLALLEETARWKMMMERSRDGIVILDAATSAVRDVNPAFAEMLGYSRGEMAGMHPWDWDISFSQEEIEAMPAEQRDGDIFFETRMRCKDGSARNVEVSSTITEFSGERQYFCICRDVTERKQAEDEIRRDKALLRCLIDSVGDLIFIKDVNGVYQACNKAAEEFIGLPESEQIGKTDFDFFDRDVAEVIHENDRQILESGKESRSEEWVTYQDGRRGLLDILKAPFYGSDGKQLGLVGISRDITQRKHAEELIRQERELCLDLVNTQPAGIYRVRVSPREQWSKNAWNSSELTPYSVELVNDRFCEILGINRLDMETKPGLAIDLVHPEDKAEFARKNEESASKLIPFLWEGRLIIQGGIIWAHFESLPRPLANGEVLWSGILYDITERKRMEEELWKSESILRKIFDSIPDLISVIDRDLRIVRSNWHGGYEYVPEDIRDKSPFCHEAYYQGQDKPCENCHTLEVFRTGKPAVIEKFNPRIGFMEMHAYPVFDDAGNVIMAIEHVRDITERKRMEEETRKAHKLESLGVLAGGIAHDFNNLLTGILGNISLAKVMTDPNLKSFKRLEEAEKAVYHARDLTQQLMTFSKGGSPVIKTVSIAQIVMDSASFVLRGSNVRCKFSVPEGIWPVKVDEGQMNQVINNLIINADQSMAEGGILEIVIENMDAAPENEMSLTEGRYVKISISDRGVGIPEQHLHKIFDPYFTTKQKGSGLGLATVYSIIKNHDGYIGVESKLGVGTTFHVYIPASENGLLEVTEGKENPHAGSGKILVMDDEEIIREVAAEILGHLGYIAVVCCNGSEAIELYQQAIVTKEPFTAVIMDLTIPGGMGGKETMKKLLEIDKGVVGIVSSGYCNDPILSSYSDYGFSGIVGKPYSLEELGKVLHDLLTGGGLQQ